MVRAGVVLCILARVAHAQQVDAVVDANVNATGNVSIEPAFPVHIEYGLDFGFGAVQGEPPMQGFAGLFAMPLAVYVNDWLGFGFRGQLTISQDPAVDDAAEMGRSDAIETPNYEAWSAAVGPRFRFYDPDQPHAGFSHRIGWVLDVEGGYVYVNHDLGQPGPLGRVLVGRQVFLVDHRGNGANIGLGLTVESGFGPTAEHRAVLASVWFHGESGATPGSTLQPKFPDHLWPSVFAIDVPMFLGTNFGSVDANMVVGLAASYGIPASELIMPLVRADTLYLHHSDTDSTKLLGASAGVQIRFNGYNAPFAVELLGGYARAYGVEPHMIGDGPFVDIGAGIHASQCMMGFDIGARLRLGLGDDNSHLASLALIIGGARGNRPGALGHTQMACSDDGLPNEGRTPRR